MNYKNLEKYEENWYNNTAWFNFPDQQETKEEEQARIEKIKQNRMRIITLRKNSKWNIVIKRTSEEALQEEYDNKYKFYYNDNQLDYMINHR